MDQLRRPFLIVALVAIGCALALCVGSQLFTDPPDFPARIGSAASAAQNDSALTAQLQERGLEPGDVGEALRNQTREQDPPGLAIPDLAVINGVLLLVLILTSLPWLVGDRVTGSIQGIVSIVGGLIGLIVSVLLAIIAFVSLLLMVSLLLAVPFGTLAYLAIFGSFNTQAGAAATAALVVLQVVSAIALLLAHQSFLKSKGLVLLYATVIVSTLVVSFLHSFVPGFLVSITDAIAAIVVCILAAIWSLVVLIGGIVSAIRLLKLKRRGSLVQIQ